MHIYHIQSKDDKELINQTNKMIENGDDVFILVYMEGCGPCNATRPEWAKLESALKKHYSKNNKLVVVDINKDLIADIKYIGSIDGFPTIKYIGNGGKDVQTYENSSIRKKDRSLDSFIDWIESTINTVESTITSSPQHVLRRIKRATMAKRAKKTPRHKRSHKRRSNRRSRARR
jgi:thiol-disulfide isomerase/thioredoxin